MIVDMQEDFMDGGSLAVKGARELIEPMNQIVTLFDDRGLPVFFTKDYHPAKHCSFKEFGGSWPAHCVMGSKGAGFACGLFVLERAQVIPKATTRDRDAYSAFQGTELLGGLKRLGIRRLFVAGVATEYCVLETVLDALREGFSVFVLSDLIAPVDPATGRDALKRMRQAGACTVSCGKLY